MSRCRVVAEGEGGGPTRSLGAADIDRVVVEVPARRIRVVVDAAHGGRAAVLVPSDLRPTRTMLFCAVKVPVANSRPFITAPARGRDREAVDEVPCNEVRARGRAIVVDAGYIDRRG